MALTGGRHLTTTFNLNILLDHPQLAHFKAIVEKAPADIKFKTNTFVSKWETLDDLVAAEAVLTSTNEVEDTEELFWAAWRCTTAEKGPPESSLRWSLQGHLEYGFKVIQQALPASASLLRGDSRLTADTCRTVKLACWPVACTMVWIASRFRASAGAG